MLFERKKKSRKDEQVKNITNTTINQNVKKHTDLANKIYYKPEYNPNTRKSYYDDPGTRVNYKKQNFLNNEKVTDPYSNSKLTLTKTEAKKKYGVEWQKHLAEVDHIEPLTQIANRSRSKAFLKSDDIKTIANDKANLQIISRTTNQNGAKGGMCQQDYSKRLNEMERLSQESGRTIPDLQQQLCEVGQQAEKVNTSKMRKRSIYNMSTTMHTAGKEVGIATMQNAAAMSGIYNIAACVKGDKDMQTAIKDVSSDTAVSGIKGYVEGAGLTAINHTLISNDSKFLHFLGENNAAGKVVTAVSVTGGSICKWTSGEISTEECVYDVCEKGCGAAGGALGGAIGQVVIPIPVIGGVVGSMTGSILFDGVYNTIFGEIRVRQNEKRRIEEQIRLIEKQLEEMRRREKIRVELDRSFATAENMYNFIKYIVFGADFKSMMNTIKDAITIQKEDKQYILECMASCALCRIMANEYKKQFQEFIEQYFRGYEYCFSEILTVLNEALLSEDYEMAIQQVNKITTTHNEKILFKDTDEFCEITFDSEKTLYF